MDRHAEGSQAWFEEVLGRSGLDATKMVRVDSPRRPAVQRSNPWEETGEIEAAAQVLRVARGPGNEPAHVIFVTDVEQDPVARVQAAVQIARAAVGQEPGQSFAIPFPPRLRESQQQVRDLLCPALRGEFVRGQQNGEQEN